MSKPQEFSIKVQSEDPKKKEKPEDKPDLEGSSKLLKDDKKKDGEEGEELVRLHVIFLNYVLTKTSSQKKINSSKIN